MRLTKRNFNRLLILGELTLYDDIKNVEEVMVGDISTLDYTALWLVHKRMLKTAEIASTTKINEYLSKLYGYTSKLNSLHSIVITVTFWYDNTINVVLNEQQIKWHERKIEKLNR